MENSNQDVNSSNSSISSSPTPKSTPLTGKTKQPKYLKSASVKILTHPVDKNIAWSFLISVVFAAIAIITGLPMVVFLTLLLAGALAMRKIAMGCRPPRCRVYSPADAESAGCLLQPSRCSASKMVNPPDSFWLHDSSFNLHIAHCLFFLDKGLGLEKLRELIKLRVINKTTENGERAFPRFSRRLVRLCCGYVWADDEKFLLENHVYEDTANVRTSHDLQDHVNSLMSQPLPSDRPLWEMRVLTNFGRLKDTILILRIHHAVSDAVSLVRILGNCLADHKKYVRLKPRFGSNTFFLNLLRTVVVGPLTFLGWVFFTRRDYNFLNRRHKPDAKVVAWSKPIKFSTVNRIKQVMRCTLNDVLVSAASGAVRALLYRNGIRNPPNVTLSLPVDLRFDPDDCDTPEMGARYACVNVRLPCNTEGAIPRLWEVRHKMEVLKTSPDPVVMYGAINYLIPILPEPVSQWLLSTVYKKATVLLSNVPGPEEMMTLGTKRLKRIIFWMASRREIPVSFSIMSYAGYIQFAVSADKSVVPRPQDLIQEVMVELGRLSHLLERRRIPGEHRRKSNFTAERRQEEIMKPPVQELQMKLHAVQEEVHMLTIKLSAMQRSPTADDSYGEKGLSSETALILRLEELKEEFSELMIELRRRKSLADGIVINVEDDDMEEDGELRKPRKRAMSMSSRRSSLASIVSAASSGRPLATPSLLHSYVVSTPNLESAGTINSSSSSSSSQQGNTSFLQVQEERFGRRKSDFN